MTVYRYRLIMVGLTTMACAASASSATGYFLAGRVGFGVVWVLTALLFLGATVQWAASVYTRGLLDSLLERQR